MRSSLLASSALALLLVAGRASARDDDASAELANRQDTEEQARDRAAPTPETATPPTEAQPARPPEAPSVSGLRPLAVGALVVGAAGLIVGVIGGIQVLSAKSTVDSHCAGSTRTCDQEGLDAADRGATWSIISPIGFGLAAVGLGVGTVLWLRSADRTPTKTGLIFSPTASAGGGGFVLGGAL